MRDASWNIFILHKEYGNFKIFFKKFEIRNVLQ